MMHHPGQEGVHNVASWAALAVEVSPVRALILGILIWSFVSVLLVGGLGAWIATMRARRDRH
jgi:hypothetical protein